MACAVRPSGRPRKVDGHLGYILNPSDREKLTSSLPALFMNRPTPEPSQEGNRRRSASCPFPSWEGLGVGSWSRWMRERERRLFMNRPNPHPSQEGSRHSSASCPEPSAFSRHAACARSPWPFSRSPNRRRGSFGRPSADFAESCSPGKSPRTAGGTQAGFGQPPLRLCLSWQ